MTQLARLTASGPNQHGMLLRGTDLDMAQAIAPALKEQNFARASVQDRGVAAAKPTAASIVILNRAPGKTSVLAEPTAAPHAALRKTWRMAASLVLASLLLGACSSSADVPITKPDGGDGGGGGGGVAGSNAGGSGNSAGNSAGTGGHVGTGGMTAPGTPTSVSLHIKWSTSRLQGTTLTPVTCQSIGANTVGFQFRGRTLNPGFGIYSTNDSECASGDDEALEWTRGSGDFSLYIGIWIDGSSTDGRALFGASVDFTVPQGATRVEIPEVTIIYRSSTVSWEILKAGVASTCAAAKANKVSIQLSENDTASSRKITWGTDCRNTPAEVSPLSPGSYTVTATLLGDGDQKIATWTAPAPLVITKDSAPGIPKMTFELP